MVHVPGAFQLLMVRLCCEGRILGKLKGVSMFRGGNNQESPHDRVGRLWLSCILKGKEVVNRRGSCPQMPGDLPTLETAHVREIVGE